MAANADRFTCQVCKQLYTNPVVHRTCGFSFDLECIGKQCPRKECGQIISQESLTVNYALLKIVDEYRLSLGPALTYYLILLDTSSSMWYSDSFLPFALGESRFTHATQFLNDFFKLKMNSMTDKISLYTFDTSTTMKFDFETIDETHIRLLKDLEFQGKDTALFDSIDFCLDKIDQVQKILGNRMSTPYLIVITDGGNNFGKKESKRATEVLWHTRKLHITGHFIQLGDKNRKKTKKICQFIEYKYNHFKGGNLQEFVNSFTNSITTEIRARNVRIETPADVTVQMISLLPDVPNTAPKIAVREKVLA
ncbi:unnamed protein product [Rotaria magnacalcarata]|uniref:VWFA domain-containing protein n=1 Tax=Rotaria magnacalcarata TaxID=392030 RepID=A0A819DBW4_9BILA|nr:unnamed protein product [Rotaria magnacalcarata]CAF3834934.1 unnamed protein product [Rotaria magnacalcarata]